MHVRTHVALLAVSALFGLAAGGCTDGTPGAVVSCMPPECPTDTTLRLVAEVDPPNDSTWVRQEFASLTLDTQTGLFALTLDAQVTLSGTVRVGKGTGSQTIPATVVATRPSRIAGRPDVYYQATVNPITGEFALVVPRSLPGEQYAVRVTAINSSLVPPKQLMVTADGDQDVDLRFDDPLTLPEIRGALLDSLGQPVPGVQVQAIDTTTLAALSTTTTTDDQGAYSVRLVPNPPATVRVVATPTLPAAQLPSLTLDLSTAKLSPTNSMTANLHVPPLAAPAHITFKVVGMGTSGAEIVEKAATCVFTADVSDPNATDGVKASYRATAMTDLLGQVDVALIPMASGNRTYAVIVSPDSQSDLSATATTVSIAPGMGYGKDIVLPLRPQVSGQVLDPQGKPLSKLMVVPGASTVAQSLGPNMTLGIAVTPRQTVADGDGRFALRLDRGVWDIGLIPPADSMLPRLWLTNAVLDADVDVGPVMLPRGVMVHGVVHDPRGVALPLANVRLYTINELNAGCSSGDSNCLVPPRLRAEGSSGADGVLSLILPSQPK
ncbi:MAG: hypothetical protein JWN44_4435 [Myxococcales bacterium]|nr:hypothetical protein [Myxococcales bacterium]